MEGDKQILLKEYNDKLAAKKREKLICETKLECCKAKVLKDSSYLKNAILKYEETQEAFRSSYLEVETADKKSNEMEVTKENLENLKILIEECVNNINQNIRNLVLELQSIEAQIKVIQNNINNII